MENSNANVTPKDREGEGEALQEDMSDMSGTLPKNDLSRLYLPSPVAAFFFFFLIFLFHCQQTPPQLLPALRCVAALADEYSVLCP